MNRRLKKRVLVNNFRDIQKQKTARQLLLINHFGRIQKISYRNIVTQLNKFTGLERRSSNDRRQNRIPFLKLIFFKGNRWNLRRTDDCKRLTLLDQYHPSLLFSVLIVLSLSMMDAFLTLTLLERGASELNPVMRYYIALGPETFVIVKYGLTALPLIIIVILNAAISTRYRIGSLMFLFCGLAFGSVVIWELYLLAHNS